MREVSDPNSSPPTSRFLSVVIPFLGLVALLSIPVIWAAWSTSVFYICLAVGVSACLLIVVFVKLFPHHRW